MSGTFAPVPVPEKERKSTFASKSLLPGILALAFLALLPAGCRHVHLNWAMERINERYVDLFYGIEADGRDEIRTEVRELVDALSEPAVTGYSTEPDYQRFLDQLNQTASLMYQEARGEDRQPLLVLRSRLFTTCQACHEQYRY